MKKLFLLFLLLFCSSCSLILVYSPKEVIVKGDRNNPTITGSELDGNHLKQDPEGTLTIPVK